MNRQFLKQMGVLALGAAAVCLMATGTFASYVHTNVPLLNQDGDALQYDSDEPYSPKKTCGFCHDYDTITAGYHFQQGFDELIADVEREAGEKPFIKSPGMYGKW